MKIRSERDKRTYLIIALCAILVVMGAGYAAFSSMLTINGTANISNSWCVGFDNTQTEAMQITKGLSTGTQPTGSMSYSGTACGSTLQPNSSLNAHFYQPGDEIEYTLTITNKSTVQAAIKSILVDNESVTQNTTKTKGNITYVVEMPAKTTLASNESTTMKVIAKFQNETDVTGNVNGETKTVEVKINAEQDDGNGGMDITPAKFTGSIYRSTDVNAKAGNTIKSETKNVWCGLGTDPYGNPYSSCDNNRGFDTEAVCRETFDDCEQGTITTGIGEYKTEIEVPTYNDRVAAFEKTYYLKHDVVDDIITASYICFVYNNAEHCMKGGDGGASFAANTQIIQDYQTFYNLGNYIDAVGVKSGCRYNDSAAMCYKGTNSNIPFGSIESNNDGYICIGFSIGGCSCFVYGGDDNSSRCY